MKPFRTITEIQDAISRKETSCAQLVEDYLSAIDSNRDLNAFLEVYGAEARQKAKETDTKIAAKTAGRLAGLVLGLKDNICYKNHKVSASSRILEGFESLYSATIVERL